MHCILKGCRHFLAVQERVEIFVHFLNGKSVLKIYGIDHLRHIHATVYYSIDPQLIKPFQDVSQVHFLPRLHRFIWNSARQNEKTRLQLHPHIYLPCKHKASHKPVGCQTCKALLQYGSVHEKKRPIPRSWSALWYTLTSSPNVLLIDSLRGLDVIWVIWSTTDLTSSHLS